jgi:hypothetical protein
MTPAMLAAPAAVQRTVFHPDDLSAEARMAGPRHRNAA